MIAAENWEIEKLQTVLDDLKFGAQKLVHLTTLPNGTLKLIPAKYTLPTISCNRTAILIQEDEIRITRWASSCGMERFGTWKGREVDLVIAWDKSSCLTVSRDSDARQKLAKFGLDLCFPIVGHVANGEHVTGIAKEPAYGRPLQMEDTALLYTAISDLQSRGIIYRGWTGWSDGIVVNDGKIRFLDLSSCLFLDAEDSEAVNEAAEKWHWPQLDAFFEDLKQWGQDFVPLRYMATSPTDTIPSLPRLQLGVRFDLLRSIVQFRLSAQSVSGLEVDDAPIGIRELSRTKGPMVFYLEGREQEDQPIHPDHRRLRAASAHPYRKSVALRRFIAENSSSRSSSSSTSSVASGRSSISSTSSRFILYDDSDETPSASGPSSSWSLLDLNHQ